MSASLALAATLAVTPVGTPIYELVEPIEIAGYEIPAGFRTDLASIPARFENAPRGLCMSTSAVLHDWLYVTHLTTRIEADRIFRDTLRECGATAIQAAAVYAAVRMFGAEAWEAQSGWPP